MRRCLYILAAMLTLLLAACGHSDTFVVKGSLSSGATMNLRVMYFTGGKVLTGITAAQDGEFAFEGRSPGDALVEIYDNDYRLLSRLVARNGDDIELNINTASPAETTVKGNEMAERWASFRRENAAGDIAAVSAYVSAHRDDPLSALIVMTEIDASTDAGALIADSLMSLINPEARATDITAGYAAMLSRVTSATSHARIVAIPYMARGGRIVTFNPRRSPLNIIAVSSTTIGHDSTLTTLRQLHGRRGLSIADFSVDNDTITWHRTVMADSAAWIQGWVAGSISGQALHSLGIPDIPYYIVADSTGRQLWRGSSPSQAAAYIDRALSKD